MIYVICQQLKVCKICSKIASAAVKELRKENKGETCSLPFKLKRYILKLLLHHMLLQMSAS